MTAIAVTIFIGIVLSYTLGMFLLGMVRRKPPATALAEHRHFVVMIPCLNEELVIGRTLDRLLGDKPPNVTVMVIDDGSDDRTAEIAESYPGGQVWVHRRVLPDARQGKGHALNAAYRRLRDAVLEAKADPTRVVVAVLDADGRLEVQGLPIVDSYFDDPSMGAVQIKVKIHNAGDGLLPRMQDVEFATFTEVFQRARARVGSSGLGGNGQFTRLTALMELGDDPWSDCLTEDLELGINLLLNGWKNEFTPEVAVSQQGVTDLRRLVRQRSRWFQGHLQCLHLVPRVLASKRLRVVTRLDLCYHLVNSVLMLVFQTFSVVWIVLTVSAGLLRPDGVEITARLAFTLYFLAFGLSSLIAWAYRRARPELGTIRCLLYAHVYVLYTYMWWAAGLIALFRHVSGESSWAKTARTVGTGDEVPLGGPGSRDGRAPAVATRHRVAERFPNRSPAATGAIPAAFPLGEVAAIDPSTTRLGAQP